MKFLAAAFLAGQGAWASEIIVCDDQLIEVTAEENNLASRACEVASEAEAIFSSFGLRRTNKISIEVTGDLAVASGHCVALYDIENCVLQVLSPDRLEEGSGRLGPFPAIPALALFDSLIVHELAHAYVNDSAEDYYISRLAHEYIAYALQLEHLPRSEREPILRKAEISGQIHLSDFSEALLNFVPARFAAMAWLHLNSQPKPADTVQGILRGRILFENLRE